MCGVETAEDYIQKYIKRKMYHFIIGPLPEAYFTFREREHMRSETHLLIDQ